MPRTPPAIPGRRSPESLYVLLELGDVLEGRFATQRHAGAHPPSLDELCDAALRRLPQVEAAFAQGGLALKRDEAKKFRGPRRRKIQRATWTRLGQAAAAFDVSRPQLLRALLRLQLQAPGPRPAPNNP